ncbi:MAG TPA: NADPH-dependent F420 reductase [Bryobacteraceae bacterium]|nr:NADPH-dependent F420 reductase [Bryobacteraceae bacterium]
MRIGIIGAGNVGSTLGAGWSKAGHKIIFGSRDPTSQKMTELARNTGATAGSNQEAAEADVVVLTTPWPATKEAVSGLLLAGKVLVDVTNPLLPDLSGLEVGTTTSGAEQVAQWANGALVVKAFNTVGFNVMAHPQYKDGDAVMFYCGDNAGAKATVHQLAMDLGFDPHDAGPLTQARYLEPFAMLWITLALNYGYGREFGFKLIRK